MPRPSRPHLLSIVSVAAWTVASSFGCGPSQPPATAAEGTTVPTGQPAAAPVPTSEPAPTPDVSAEPADTQGGATRVTASRLVAGVEPGRFELVAYVIELRPCPACPPPLSCKPCLGDQIVVHDVPDPAADAPKPMIRMKPGQITQVQEGTRYRFRVDAVGEGSTVNHIEVVSFEPLS